MISYWWNFTTKLEPNSSEARKLRPDACAGVARAASRQNPNPLIIFLRFPPPCFLEIEKGVGFVGITLLA